MSIARRRIEGKPRDEWPLVIRYTGRDGRRHTETIQSGLKKDAQRRLREIEIEKEHGLHVPKSQTENMAFLLKLWLDHYEVLVKRGIKAYSTFLNYKRDVKLHLLPEFGGTLITRLEAIHVQHFVDNLMSRRIFSTDGTGKRRERQYSLSRLKVITIPVKLALDFAVDHKLVGRNVLKDRPIRLPEARESTRPWLEFEDAKALLRACDQRKALGLHTDDSARLWRNQSLLIMLLMFTGMRESEACGLQWEDIDLSKRMIHVRHQMTRLGQVTERLKTKKARRSIPVNEMLYQALVNHASLEERHGQVLSGANNQPMRSYVVIQTIIPKVMKRAGLVKDDGTHKFTAHQLRHFAGSIWLAEGMPLDQVSRLLGHGSSAITQKVYIHQLQHDDRAAVAIERIGALISGQPVPTVQMIEQAIAEPEVRLNSSYDRVIEMPVSAPQPAPIRTIKDLRAMQRGRALELWKANRSAAEIAAELGVTNVTVTSWIQEDHGDLRRAVRMARAYEKLTPEQITERQRKNRERYHERRKQMRETASRNVTPE
jgi:integrase